MHVLIDIGNSVPTPVYTKIGTALYIKKKLSQLPQKQDNINQTILNTEKVLICW